MPLTKVASSMLASGASGSGGSAGKNYISSYNGNPCNGDFESGSISGWSVFSVSSITNGLPSGVPTTIAAGGSNPDITLVSPGSQLAGQYSLQASFPISTSANKGFITEVFTIDAQDRAQVLTFGFHYQLTSSASNVNFSGTSSNTFIVSVYAVDGSNAGWIQPAGVYSMTQSSGAGFATGTFQTYSDTTQYRFAILCFNNPTTTSATVTFDDFSVGPTAVINGTPVTDWQSYTPTFTNLGVVTGTDFKWRRVGNVLEIIGYGKSATVASNQRFTLPAGLNIDTSVSGVSATNTLGFFNRLPAAAGSTVTTGGLFYDSALGTQVLRLQTRSDTGLYETTATAAISNNEGFSCRAFVPIQGWSSNVQISSDTDTRVAAFSYKLSANYSYTSGVNIYCDSLLIDTHGAYSVGNTTSGSSYIVPVSGIWKFKNSSDISGTSGYSANIKKNNIVYGETGWISDAGFYEWLVPCNAGDVITIQAGASASIGPLYTSFSGFRLSGPSVVAASETVAARYYSSSTAISGSLATIVYATKDYDTHNAYSAGIYTIPVSGKYQVQAGLSVIYTSSATATTQLRIYKGATQITDTFTFQGVSSTATPSNFTSDIVNCVAGEQITIKGFSSSTSPTIRVDNFYNYFSIVRVGN
jgi:hypothetical protein